MIAAVPARAPAPDVGAGLLSGLTVDQAAAVAAGPGPQLIVACPGAGKTEVLARRVAYLTRSGQALPAEILAITFTTRAAGEMQERLGTLLGPDDAGHVTAATFHSVCARIIRSHAHLLGRSDRFSIYDQTDVKKIVGYVLSDKNRAGVVAAAKSGGRPPLDEVCAEISTAKNALQDPDAYQQHSAHPARALIAAAWKEVNAEMRTSDALDFDDLLCFTVALLACQPDLAAYYRGRWPYVLVDEFQDTNGAQAALCALLCGAHGNLFCVGDPDQALYRWRGADPTVILNFTATWPTAVRHLLGDNFRSTQEIVAAADQAIARNTQRVARPMRSARGPGGDIAVVGHRNEFEEASWAAGEVLAARNLGIVGEQVMICARSLHATRQTQYALARAGIAHRVLGSLGLYERAEVKDALAYLTLLVNPRDAMALRRCAQSPARGAGEKTLAAVVEHARLHTAGDLIDALRAGGQIPGIRQQKARDALEQLGHHLDRLRREQGRSLAHQVGGALTMPGGLVAAAQANTASEDPKVRADAHTVLEDLRNVVRATQAYEQRAGEHASLHEFLEMASGLNAVEVDGHGDDRVTVSTIHAVKGAQAELVLVLGCEERSLPGWRALDDPDPIALEEERRVFYVAVTRAKRLCRLSWAASRNHRDAEPSRFIAEAGLA